jgi:hypothetical protein
MKRFLPFILCAFFAIQTKNSLASHLLGGEISWKCLKSGTNAGKFVFNMKLYCACYTGVSPCPSGPAIHNPLYAQYGGVPLIPLSRKEMNELSNPCFNPSYSYGCNNSISSGGYKAAMENVYKSAPVQINGIERILRQVGT